MVSETNNEVQPDPAEATDGSNLGEEIGDDRLPGTVGFPPTTPAGVGAADSLQDADHHDSVRERNERQVPEGRPRPHDAVRLLDPSPSGEPDLEPELIADDVPAIGLVSPEEAAMHLESDE